MINDTKNRWMLWAVLVLLVMNVSTWVTIYVHSREEKQGEQEENRTIPGDVTGRFSGRYFREALGLSQAQMAEFTRFNPQFRHAARQINFDLLSLRTRMLDELSKPSCDTVRLNMLSDSIGICHSMLKRETYRYYLEFRAVCTEEQQVKLREIFNEAFDLNARPGGYGQGGPGGSGRGRHQGNNN